MLPVVVSVVSEPLVLAVVEVVSVVCSGGSVISGVEDPSVLSLLSQPANIAHTDAVITVAKEAAINLLVSIFIFSSSPPSDGFIVIFIVDFGKKQTVSL